MSQAIGMDLALGLPDDVRLDVVARAHALYCNQNGGIDLKEVLDTPGGDKVLARLQADLEQGGNDSHLSGAW